MTGTRDVWGIARSMDGSLLFGYDKGRIGVQPCLENVPRAEGHMVPGREARVLLYATDTFSYDASDPIGAALSIQDRYRRLLDRHPEWR